MDPIRKIIREQVEIIFENFEYQDSQKHKKYYPTPQMKDNAQKALDAVSKNDLTESGENEGSGKSKAQTIINGDEMSHSTIKRMKAYFDNNTQKYQAEKAIGRTIDNSGVIQSWNLWGGDEGKKFASDHINNLNSSNFDRKKHRRTISNGTGTGSVTRLIDTNYHRKK